MKNKLLKNKFIATFVMIVMLMVMVPILASSVSAQKYYYYRDRAGRLHRTTKKPSFYRRHLNASNIGIATGAGALIGAVAGGGKGALVGAGVGAGSGALYTYKLKKKKRHYVKRRRY